MLSPSHVQSSPPGDVPLSVVRTVVGSAVGSVVGFGGMCGAIGGMGISKVTGYLLETTGSYLSVFIMAGCMYLIALAVIHLLVPRMTPVRLD